MGRHQVETSVNPAPGNGVLTWYVGGLNYQIEHPTARAALASHARWVQRLGQLPAEAA
jgi:hypothetical protein